MRIIDWSSDGCSSDLLYREGDIGRGTHYRCRQRIRGPAPALDNQPGIGSQPSRSHSRSPAPRGYSTGSPAAAAGGGEACVAIWCVPSSRSEEHTSELQSLMRISYAVFCLKKK